MHKQLFTNGEARLVFYGVSESPSEVPPSFDGSLDGLTPMQPKADEQATNPIDTAAEQLVKRVEARRAELEAEAQLNAASNSVEVNAAAKEFVAESTSAANEGMQATEYRIANLENAIVGQMPDGTTFTGPAGEVLEAIRQYRQLA